MLILNYFLSKILSKREHLLVVPTENLEDVRKNITAAKEAEVQESSSSENQAFFENDASEYAPEVKDNNLAWTFHSVKSSSTTENRDECQVDLVKKTQSLLFRQI